MYQSSSLYLCVCALVVGIAGGHALAREDVSIGKTLGVKSTSTASGRVLHGEDPILVRDRINTSASGEVQLEFLDQTRIVVGPNSSLGVRQYLASSQRAAKHIGVAALGGAVRFISGKSGSKAYTIDTPTATIGVRGTRFDIAVTRQRTAVLVYEGEVRLCSNGSCVRVSNRCEIGLAEASRAPVLTNSLRINQSELERDFPYAFRQQTLPRNFRANTSGCIERANLEQPKTEGTRPSRPADAAAPSPVEPSGEVSEPGGDPGTGGSAEEPGGDRGDRGDTGAEGGSTGAEGGGQGNEGGSGGAEGGSSGSEGGSGSAEGGSGGAEGGSSGPEGGASGSEGGSQSAEGASSGGEGSKSTKGG